MNRPSLPNLADPIVRRWTLFVAVCAVLLAGLVGFAGALAERRATAELGRQAQASATLHAAVLRSELASRWTPEFSNHILGAARRALQRRAREDVLLAVHEDVPRDMWSVFAAEAEHGADDEVIACEEAMRKAFGKLSREKAERRGDVAGVAARYGYISFHGAGLLVNKVTRNMLAKLHGNLCHPG